MNLYSNDLANDESTTNQRDVSMKRAAFIILTLFVTWCPALGAKTLDLDSATIADINAAFNAGTPDRGGSGPIVPGAYPEL